MATDILIDRVLFPLVEGNLLSSACEAFEVEVEYSLVMCRVGNYLHPGRVKPLEGRVDSGFKPF